MNARLNELSQSTLTSEVLTEQETIIGFLNAGDVITVGNDLQPALISLNSTIDNPAFNVFQRFANATSGIMGYASSSEGLTPLIEKMSAHMLKAAESSESINIAFVLDTTVSMKPYINEVKENLVRFVGQLQKKAEEKLM